MRYLTSLAVISMAGVSHAQLGGFERRMPDECCPCPAGGEPANQGPVTVTVTGEAPPAQTVYLSNGPKETVTVDNTVTASGTTVYLTQTSTPETITKEAPKEPVTEEMPQEPVTQKEPQEPQVVTKTLQPKPPKETPAEEPEQPEEPKGPKTVTVSIGQAPKPEPQQPQTVTVLPSPEVSQPKDTQQQPKVVTVTQQPEEPSPAPSPEDQKPEVVTKTAAQPKPEAEKTTVAPEEPKTVFISAVPSVQTVTRNGQVTTRTVLTPSAVTVTAAPKTINNYETVTQTVSNGNGNIDVEITIINIDTGESSCVKKNSGQPCNGTPAEQSTLSVCPPATATTSYATAYNTVTFTVNAPDAGNATVSGPEPTGLRARKPHLVSFPRKS